MKRAYLIIKTFLWKMKQLIYKDPRPSVSEIDDKLEKYLNYKNGFFIEVGANDGYTQSNTYFLEKRKNWSGILIEGIPELYSKCKKLRSSSTVYNCALVSNNFVGNKITMHYAGLMSVVDGSLKSEEIQHKHLNEGLNIQKITKSYSVDVPTRTLESILIEYKNLPKKIDFFSLDVEGNERSVLEGLNLNKFRPEYILVEATHFEEVNSILIEHGYILLEKLSHHDFLYKNPEETKS